MQQTWLIVRLIIKRRLKIRHIITTTKNKDTTIMKKLIMLIVAATLSLHGLAANIDEVFTKIKNTVKVEELRFDADMMKAMAGDKSETAKEFVNSLKELHLLALDNPSDADRNAFKSSIAELDTTGYKVLMDEADTHERVKMIVLAVEGKVKEFIITIDKDENNVLMRVLYDLDEEQMDKLGKLLNIK